MYAYIIYIGVGTDIMCIHMDVDIDMCIHLSIFRYTWGNIKERIIANTYNVLTMCWVLSQHFILSNSHDKSVKEI